MKLEKAIEILDAIVLTIDPDRMTDDEDAIKLGIEALKRVQSQRMPNASIIFHPLPGETKD